MVDFAALKKNRGSNSKLMKDQLKKQERGGHEDERFWKQTYKEDGNDHISENVIRFLPVSKVDMEKLEAGDIDSVAPIAKIDKFMFKTQLGKWFVENSITTFAEASPIAEHDGPLWDKWKDQGRPDGALKNTLVGRLPKDEMICNILVIEDGTNPENNGKQFLYKIPKTIVKMMDEAENPKFKGQTAIDPWDLWETGANLNLNIIGEEKEFNGKKVITPEFKNSTWSQPCEVGDDDLKGKLWENAYSLSDFYDRKHFKSYDELKNKFYLLMYGDQAEMMMKKNGVGGEVVKEEKQDPPEKKADLPPKKEEKKADLPPKKEEKKADLPPKKDDDVASQEPPSDEGGGDDMDEFEAMLNE